MLRVKPVEPENITGNLSKVVDEDVPKVSVCPCPRSLFTRLSSLSRVNLCPFQPRAPISSSSRPSVRPPRDAPMTRLKANVAKSMLAALEKNPLSSKDASSSGKNESAIAEGEPCKNGGCKQVRSLAVLS